MALNEPLFSVFGRVAVNNAVQHFFPTGNIGVRQVPLKILGGNILA